MCIIIYITCIYVYICNIMTLYDCNIDALSRLDRSLAILK